ncbi:hypothetical protein ACFOHI_11230, partial [Paracoccus aerius]
GDGNDWLHGGQDNDLLYGGTGRDTLAGGFGDDTLEGGQGNDVLIGGEGFDRAVYQGSYANYAFSNGTITDLVGNSGSDTLSGVEMAVFDDKVVWLVGENGIRSLQEAVNLASEGDTIIVSAGSYNENVVIDKTLTILGANAGSSADGSRQTEASLNGSFEIMGAAAGTIIDGMQIQEGGPRSAGIFVRAADVQILNSVFTREATGGDFKGILNASGTSSGLLVDGNSFIGWTRGIYLNPGARATVTNNIFDESGNAINNDGPDAVEISGNRFTNSAGATLAFGVKAGGTTNIGSIVGVNEFDESRPTNIYVLDPDLLVTGTRYADGFFGNTGAETLSGGAGNDTIRGEAGNDMLFGNQGDDLLEGGSGDDWMHGGQNSDQLYGGEGRDTLGGGFGDDTLDGGIDIDTATYETAISGVTVNLNNQGVAQLVSVSEGRDT